MKTLRLSVFKNGKIKYMVNSTHFNAKDIEQFDRLIFDFSPNMSKEDRIKVCKQWSHKELLPEHKLYYVDKVEELNNGKL